jgi:hypothetical protein
MWSLPRTPHTQCTTTADRFSKRPVIKVVAGDWLLAAINAALLKIVIEQVHLFVCANCFGRGA